MDLLEVPKTSFRRHPWEVARARFFRTTLQRAGALDSIASVLDVGAGDGYLSSALLESMPVGSRVTCLDPHYTADDVRRFAASAAEAAVTFCTVRPKQRFDIILLLDVVEHVENDQQFVNDYVSQNLAPDGVLLVSVPALQLLFTQHDVGLKHFRRYSPRGLRTLLEDSDLTITKSGGLFHSPLFPRAVTALRESLARRMGRPVAPSPHVGQWRGGPVMSNVVERCLMADNFLSAKASDLGWSLPGLSCWALCRRKRQ
ncbi:MAG: methyltransferase domain-containing protein [Polyangia bacterium]